MKRLMLLVLLILAVPFSTQGCLEYQKVHGSGKVVKEERRVRGITGVELATFGNLYIKLGDKEKLEIQAEDNLIQYFETEVRAGMLTIEVERLVNLRPRKPVRFYLMVKKLDTIALSSSGNIEAPDLEAKRFYVKSSSSGSLTMGNLDASTLEVRMSSSGNVRMGDLNARELEVDISSSGDLNIAGGEVEEQDITLSSSGSYKARDLGSAEARVRISSSGGATIRVRDYLKANISSSGSVHYIGNPKVDKSVSSSGRAKRIRDWT